MVKGCFPGKVVFEQRPEGEERVSRATACSHAGQTLLHFRDRHSRGLCEGPETTLRACGSSHVGTEGKRGLGRSTSYAGISATEGT